MKCSLKQFRCLLFIIILCCCSIEKTAAQIGGISLSTSTSNICSGSAVTLTASIGFATSSAVTLDFQYDNGNGNGYVTFANTTGTFGSTFTYTNYPTTSGIYRVQAYSMSSPYSLLGQSNLHTVNVYITPSPSTISPSSISTCTGTTLTASSVTGATYQWYRNGIIIPGATSTTYATDTTLQHGTYLYTLNTIFTNTNPVVVCSSISTDTATVTLTKPDATITTSTGSSVLCANSTIMLSVPASTTCTYQWKLNGSAILGATSVSYTATPGLSGSSYTYSVAVTDTSGCVGRGSIVITTLGAPVNVASSICVGDTIKIIPSDSASGITYSWIGPNSFTSSNGKIIKGNSVYTDSGKYYLTESTPGCTLHDTVDISISTFPASLTTTGSNGCFSQPISFSTASATTGTLSYSWTGPNGFSSSLQDPVIGNAQYADSGEYKVVVTHNGCAVRDSVHIAIHALAAIPALTNYSPLCTGSSGWAIVGTFPYPPHILYSWTNLAGINFGAGNLQFINVNFVDSGKYILHVLDSTTNCVALDTVNIVVKQSPVKPVAGSNNPICLGAAINFSGTDASSGITWHWVGPGGFNSNTQNPVITTAAFADTGMYIVTTTLNGCTAADTTHIVILAAPSSLLVTGNTSICIGDSLKLTGYAPNPGIIYNWTGPNSYSNSTSSIAIPNAIISNAGSYSLSVNMGNICSLTDTVNVKVLARPVLTMADTEHTCYGGTINLTTGLATTGVQYSWMGPNGYYSSIQNTSITYIPYADSGRYVVTATNGGCTAKDSIYVTVATPPAAPQATYSSPVCMGDTLKIICLPPLPGISYSWVGPGGYASTQQSVVIPNASAINAGTYILTTSNAVCPAVEAITIQLNAAPAKPVISSNSLVCSGTTVTFNPLSITGATYTWSGPTGFNSAMKNATRGVALADSGYYIVKATLNGCSASDTTHITVNVGPANVTYSSNSPICVGDTLKLVSNSSTPAVTYAWYGPAGANSVQQNFNVINTTVSNAGKYAVAVSYNTCVVNDTLTVIIKPTPAAPVLTSNSPLCSGTPLNLGCSSTTAGVNYIWSGANGFSSLQQNPTVNNTSTAATGSYTAKAVLNGCASLTGGTIVTVTQTPAGTASSNSPVCANDTLQLTGTATPAGVAFTWTGPNGFGSNLPSPVIHPVTTAANGTYTLLLSLSGCFTSLTVPVAIIPSGGTPTIHISTAKDTVCTGDMTTFMATTNNVGNPVYKWTLNGTVVGSTTNTYSSSSLRDNDVIQCSVVSTAACQPIHTAISNSIKVSVQVLHAPPVTITVYPQAYNPGTLVTFTAITTGSSNCLLYQWRLNGTDIPGANSSSYESYRLNKGDKISLYIHSNCVCTNPDTLLTNAIGLGVGSIIIQNNYKIYPNPAYDEMTIEGPAGNIQLEMYDMSGKQMWMKPIQFMGGSAKVHLSLPAGVYTLSITDGEGNREVQRLSVL